MDSRRRTEGQRATGWRRLALIGAGAVGLMMMSLAAFPVVASADQTGKVRTGYFSSDAGNVDFYVDSQKAWSNVAYKTLSTYMDVSAGQHTIAVRTAGSDANSAPLAQVQQAVDAGGFYTSVAAGKTGQQKAVVFQDSLSTPPSGKVMARFVHLAPEVPAVDVAVKGGPVLFKNVAFLGGTQYATVDAGTYNLFLHQSSDTNPSTSLFNADGVQVTGGTIVTMIGSGGVGVPVELVKTLDAASASSTPQGGAATGGGGLALRRTAAQASVLAGLLMAALLLGFGWRRLSY